MQTYHTYLFPAPLLVGAFFISPNFQDVSYYFHSSPTINFSAEVTHYVDPQLSFGVLEYTNHFSFRLYFLLFSLILFQGEAVLVIHHPLTRWDTVPGPSINRWRDWGQWRHWGLRMRISSDQTDLLSVKCLRKSNLIVSGPPFLNKESVRRRGSCSLVIVLLRLFLSHVQCSMSLSKCCCWCDSYLAGMKTTAWNVARKTLVWLDAVFDG